MKLPLEHLRDEVPLSEFEFAAVRARVRGEIARREERHGIFRFAAAAAMVVLLVLALLPSKPAQVPAGVARAGVVRASGAPPVPQGAPEARTTRLVHRRRIHRHTEPPPIAVSRIEIHTADPDIRIIWIVPKESS